MKWFIASDIHGSAYYCRKMLEAFVREGCKRMILLGDILYHGPRNDLPREYAPKEVIALLNPLADRIYCVRGNCEAEVDQMVLDFPVLADYMLLPAGDEQEHMVFITHGHLYNMGFLPKYHGDIFISGHSHKPLLIKEKDIIYANPGSIGNPRGGSDKGYLIFEDNKLILKNIDKTIIKELNI